MDKSCCLYDHTHDYANHSSLKAEPVRGAKRRSSARSANARVMPGWQASYSVWLVVEYLPTRPYCRFAQCHMWTCTPHAQKHPFFLPKAFAQKMQNLQRRHRVNQDLPRFIKEDEIWLFTLDSLFERPLIQVRYFLWKSFFTAAAQHTWVNDWHHWVIRTDQFKSQVDEAFCVAWTSVFGNNMSIPVRHHSGESLRTDRFADRFPLHTLKLEAKKKKKKMHKAQHW